MLGLEERLEECLAEDDPDPAVLNGLFWGACHGGQRSTAVRLRARGADVSWVGWDGLTPLGAAARGGHRDVVTWLLEIGGQ